MGPADDSMEDDDDNDDDDDDGDDDDDDEDDCQTNCDIHGTLDETSCTCNCDFPYTGDHCIECEPGFEIDNGECTNCRGADRSCEINEICEDIEGTPTCSPCTATCGLHASCTLVDGNPKCECDSNFEGDGFT